MFLTEILTNFFEKNFPKISVKMCSSSVYLQACKCHTVTQQSIDIFLTYCQNKIGIDKLFCGKWWRKTSFEFLKMELKNTLQHQCDNLLILRLIIILLFLEKFSAPQNQLKANYVPHSRFMINKWKQWRNSFFLKIIVII